MDEEDDSDMIDVDEMNRRNTHERLSDIKDEMLNLPRNIREALYTYTLGDLDESIQKDINDAFSVIEPTEEPIVVYRGIQSSAEDLRMQFPSFISTSASIDVAKDFRGDSVCCLFKINVPAGSKVLYIPREMHYEEDDEEEVLLQGGGELQIVSEEREGEYVVNYVAPFATKFNVSRMISIKNEMEIIGELNSIALKLGVSRGHVIGGAELTEVGRFLQSNRERAEKYFNILMKELTPRPFEIAPRPVDRPSPMLSFVLGADTTPEWDIPVGVPFNRIAGFLLFLFLNNFSEEINVRGKTMYEVFNTFCKRHNIPSSFVFHRLGAFSLDSHAYQIALELDEIPTYLVSPYVKKFISLLITDTDESRKQLRLRMLRRIKRRVTNVKLVPIILRKIRELSD
jgi:hypothetical protein